MCGISGFLDSACSFGPDESRRIALQMAEQMHHRGPDDSGAWVDAGAGIALSHRRLSILDLSAEGHQPMLSSDGRFVLTFNGEIYNFADIRRELEESGAAPRWRGHSDTEIILAGFSRWGVADTVARMVGMFAFGAWDQERRELWLARDRMGEKPLYYGRAGSALLFASELKAMRAYPAGRRLEVDRGALALFVRFGYVPSPYSIYEGIFKLPPASLLRVSSDAFSRNGGAALVPERYWDLRQVALRGGEAQFKGSEAEAAETLEELLRRAVREQMVADVPLGAFLSGGIDSSCVVALMQAESARPVRTFSVGFEERGFNEAEHAKAVARHLGTDHVELYATGQDALDVIPRLPELYDEPFGDSSQIPTYLVAKMARRYVTVALSGDGGDEVFGGYNRYFWGSRIQRTVGGVPAGVRRLGKRLLTGLSPQAWDNVARLAGVRHGSAGDKVHKVAQILEQKDPHSMYLCLLAQGGDSPIVLNPAERPVALLDGAEFRAIGDFTESMMCLDALTYLPDDVLTKVDRAAMAVSLETRIPYLDHRVVEFAWTLPLGMKIYGKQGKRLLRRVLYKHVPRELVERPKMGFGVPIATWLRGPLREWAGALLAENRLEARGFLDSHLVTAKWHEHLSGRRNWHGLLWNVLMFEAWFEAQRSPQAVLTSA